MFNTLMHRLGSWMISLLTISGFQLIGAILALFGECRVFCYSYLLLFSFFSSLARFFFQARRMLTLNRVFRS